MRCTPLWKMPKRLSPLPDVAGGKATTLSNLWSKCARFFQPSPDSASTNTLEAVSSPARLGGEAALQQNNAASRAVDKSHVGHPPATPPVQLNMISSSILSSGHVHKPLIRFLGKRVFDTPAPVASFHPLAPEDIKAKFADFLQHQKNPQPIMPTSSNQQSMPNLSKERVLWYDDRNELPWKYATPSQTEIELINGGGIIR